MPTQLPENFDPENQEGNSWELLPDGEYIAEIIEATVQQPKSGDGYHIALTWKIVDGPHEGRGRVWQRITFLHSSEQAQTIGRKTLKDLCGALGINEQVEDVEVFLFKPARIKLGIEKDKSGQFDDKNRVKRILPLAATDQPSPPAQSVPSPPAKVATQLAASAAKPTMKPTARPAGAAPWHQG
jgi:Protein of unknown function (DUF669)